MRRILTHSGCSAAAVEAYHGARERADVHEWHERTLTRYAGASPVIASVRDNLATERA